MVELLVVISIIGVLVSLLLPSISSSREQARRSACGSNLRQVFLGLENYATDSKECYPFKGAATHAHYMNIKPYFREQYLGDKNKVLYCPSGNYQFNSLRPDGVAARNEGYFGYWYLGGQGNALTGTGAPQFPPEQWAQRSTEGGVRIVPTVSRLAADKTGNANRRPLILDAMGARGTGAATNYSREEQASRDAYPNRNHVRSLSNGAQETAFANIIFVDGGLRIVVDPDNYPLRWTNAYNGNLHFP
jgi:type II secretory pathway pseudopilin PulG